MTTTFTAFEQDEEVTEEPRHWFPQEFAPRDPMPLPEPSPLPGPRPEPVPNPAPGPFPVPDPTPQPAPEPPMPLPDPIPQPVPDPIPEPGPPAPLPEPKPEPPPEPSPLPAPEPPPPVRVTGPSADQPSAQPPAQPPDDRLVPVPELRPGWSILNFLFEPQRVKELEEMRESEPDDPCTPTITTARVFRDAGVAVLAKFVGGAATLFAGGVIAYPLGLVAGSLTQWAFAPAENPEGRRLGMPLRAEVALAIEAVDLIMCAEDGRLDRCRVINRWGAGDYRQGLDWTAEILAERFGVSLTADLVTSLVYRQPAIAANSYTRQRWNL